MANALAYIKLYSLHYLLYLDNSCYYVFCFIFWVMKFSSPGRYKNCKRKHSTVKVIKHGILYVRPWRENKKNITRFIKCYRYNRWYEFTYCVCKRATFVYKIMQHKHIRWDLANSGKIGRIGWIFFSANRASDRLTVPDLEQVIPGGTSHPGRQL